METGHEFAYQHHTKQERNRFPGTGEQRRRRWWAVCASVAILYGAICAPGPAAADNAALPEILTLEEAADFLRVEPRLPLWVVCHEYRRSKRRCAPVREMKEGPSGSAIRS